MAAGRQSLGREFNWLWSAYAVSSLGTGLAFGAFPLVVILVLHGGSGEVSALAAAGQAVGAVVAIPLAPWIEFRRKRPVMVAMDLTRCAALLTVPLAFAFGHLTFAQLVIVSVFVEAADITFKAASGACMKALVRPEDLLSANSWFESTNWTSIVLGPPLGGLLIGAFGPVTTVVADAVSFLASACSIRAIGGHESKPVRAANSLADPAAADVAKPSGLRVGELFEGWRFILRSPALRPLFFNSVMVNGLIMATEPLLAVLMLGRLGFAPWQYGLAFSVPCIGGLVASRFARRIGARFGHRKVILVAGTVRAFWPIGLVAMRPGVGGLVIVMGVELGLIVSCGIYNPVYATYRLQQTPNDRVSRVLSAWSVSSNTSIAVLTALTGVVAQFTTPLTGIGAAGLCLLASPFLLPWKRPVVRGEDLVGEAGGADRLLVMRRQPDDELVGE